MDNLEIGSELLAIKNELRFMNVCFGVSAIAMLFMALGVLTHDSHKKEKQN